MFQNSRYLTKGVQIDVPRSDHDITLLHQFYNFKNEETQLLHSVSLISSFISEMPHPVKIIFGAHGASKSTTMRKDKSIVDPDKCFKVAMPKTRQDLAIWLAKQYYPCFDNISNISPDMSDLLCIASTGGSVVKRQLYSDDDTKVLDFQQPVTLNGINVMAQKADLLDRSLLFELERISSSEYKTESKLWAEFEAARPLIMGVIFTILSKAMAIHPTVELTRLGRMADFTVWGWAIAEAAGLGGDNFIDAYFNNRNNANDEALEADPVALAVVKFMSDKPEWSGSATSLFGKLNELADDNNINTRSKLWVQQPNQLSRRLNEIMPNLEHMGLTVISTNSAGIRTLTITNNTLPARTTQQIQRRKSTK
ncbi:MAG: hypothetical protein FWE91_12355 [Defluviitaleaceae bacterium]|nr:hypothetical protein [Defluviitaleaceae bacterium]MCL2836640.1 hypothetical protein [Defluviitaleaceae bacterium]